MSCGKSEGVVGRVDRADAGGHAVLFETEFVDNPNLWQLTLNLPRASVAFGQSDAQARDGQAAELRFPGDPARVAGDAAGPAYVTQMETAARFGFGRLSSRVSFGTCAAGEEVIQSILGYFADGSDGDRNGIADDIEIDLQVACSAPNYLYLTVFTDYERTASGEQFRKSSHIIDFASGAEYDSVAVDSDEFTQTATRSALVRPALLKPGNYYELGFEWRSDSLRFFLVDGFDEIALWTLADPVRVPQRPVALMYNLWHPDTHWFPSAMVADFPASDLSMRVDWLRYESVSP
jgi:hypothetical protein